MKINTKQAIKDLAGKAIPFDKNSDFTVGFAVSNILLDARTGGKMKLFILAQKFYSDKEVDLDSSDAGLVREAIEQTQNYNNLVNGQLLQLLDSSKK